MVTLEQKQGRNVLCTNDEPEKWTSRLLRCVGVFVCNFLYIRM